MRQSLRYASWLLLLFILLSCSHRVTGEATALPPILQAEAQSQKYNLYAEKKNQIINMMMPYQIDAALMEGTDTMVFHDMPIHPGYEITQDVMEKHLETILDEAENRRHAEKGLLVYLITGKLDA